MSTKKCTGPCGRDLPLDSFYKAETGTDGFRSDCKECVSEKKKQHYASNKEKVNERDKRYCESHKEEITKYHRRYRQDNKERIAARQKRYHENNKEKSAKKRKQYYSKNKERVLAQQKQYYVAHREEIANQVKQYAASHRKEAYARTKRYTQTAKGQLSARARKANRRARKKNAQGSHTAQELQEQLVRQKHKCYYCKARLGKKRSAYHADHIVPLAQGGTNYIDNIVLACSVCNLSKGSNLLHEWPNAGRLL